LISYLDALLAIRSNPLRLAQDSVALEDATGRFLARDILSDRDYPPFNRATMDGYAIRSADYSKGRKYEVRSWKHAGEPLAEKSDCIGISTGAAVPTFFDSVIRIEDAITAGDTVEFKLETVSPFLNIAIKGEDLKIGEVALRKGQQIHTGVALALSSLGARRVDVFSNPRVRIVSSGTEIVSADMIPEPEQIRDSNSFTLRSCLSSFGITPVSVDRATDEIDNLTTSLVSGLNSDLLLVTGGVSKGPRDHIPGILSSLGFRELFHGVSIKPGKPIYAGLHENGCFALGLPGNPFSVLVACEICLRPLILSSVGSQIPLCRPATFRDSRVKKGSLDEFFPVAWSPTGLKKASWNGSGDITAGVHSDGVVLHRAMGTDLKDGDSVEFYPWSW